MRRRDFDGDLWLWGCCWRWLFDVWFLGLFGRILIVVAVVGVVGGGKIDDNGWRLTPQTSRRRLSIAILGFWAILPRWSVVDIPIAVSVSFLPVAVPSRLVVFPDIRRCGVVTIPRFCSAVTVALWVVFVVLEASSFATDNPDNLIHLFLAC